MKDTMRHHSLFAVIVDDDEDDVFLLSHTLEKFPFFSSVTSFTNSAKAVEFLITSAQIPDVLITDAHMPGLNGFDLIHAVKNITSLADLPIILLSTELSQLDINRAKELGAAGFGKKPSDIEGFQNIAIDILSLLTISWEELNYTSKYLLLFPPVK